MMVTVGPFKSHREWNVDAAQPSRDARQQSFQRCSLCATGCSMLVKLAKCSAFFPTMTEFSKPSALTSTEPPELQLEPEPE